MAESLEFKNSNLRPDETAILEKIRENINSTQYLNSGNALKRMEKVETTLREAGLLGTQLVKAFKAYEQPGGTNRQVENFIEDIESGKFPKLKAESTKIEKILARKSDIDKSFNGRGF